MSVKFEETATNRGVLTFTVPQEEAKVALKQAFNRVKKNVSIPGFRKGKVNYSVFVKMYGEQALYEDAVNIVLPSAYAKAVKEEALDVVGQPKFEIVSMEKGQDWELKATVALKPEVKLGQFKDLEVTKQEREVKEEEIEDRLKTAQENLAELTLKEAAAETGDTVVIDFEGFKDGEPFEGGKGENYSLELGSNSFIPGFEDQLIGKSEGDEVEVKVTFPEEYQAEDLAGKDAVFNVKIHEVKAKEVPELDDEFAKDVDDEVATLEELKEKYRKEITTSKEEMAKDAIAEEAVQKAIDNAEFTDIPEEMIKEETDRQVDHYLNEMQRQGISADLFYQLSGSSEDALRAQFEAGAENRVKTNLLLEQIVKDENISPSKEDVESEIHDLAETYGMDEAQVRQAVTEDMLKNDIALKQAMKLITDTAKEV